MSERKCRTCLKAKALTEFYLTNKTRCRVCCIEAAKAWSAAHPAKVRKHKRKFYAKYPGYQAAYMREWRLRKGAADEGL